jgi:hypothetical protein
LWRNDRILVVLKIQSEKKEKMTHIFQCMTRKLIFLHGEEEKRGENVRDITLSFRLIN